MSYRLFVFWLAVVAAQVLGAPHSFGAVAAEQPAWFNESMAREKKVRRTSKFKLPGDVLKGRMPGKMITQPVKSEGSWYFSSNLGTEAPFECAFFEEPLNAAFATKLIGDNIVSTMVESVGPLQAKAIAAVDVSHVEGRPILALEWIYTVGAEDNAQVGLAKVRSTTVGEALLVCFHNELGYRSTFESAFAAVVKSLASALPDTAYYEALYIQSANAQPIGFLQTSFFLDADGDTRSVLVNTALIPVDATTLSTSDSTSVAYSTPEGQLINALNSGAENGELVIDLELRPPESREDGEGWQVVGDFQGKPLDVLIESSSVLLSDLGQVLATAELQRNVDQNSVTITAWMPDVDPTNLLPVEIVLDPADRNSGHMQVGGIDMQVQLDRSGNMVSGKGAVGPATVAIERVWERGQIPAPQQKLQKKQ